jgi:hypothetical protein
LPIPPGVSLIRRSVNGSSALARDLEKGTWDVRYGHLRTQPHFEGSLRLIVGQP